MFVTQQEGRLDVAYMNEDYVSGYDVWYEANVLGPHRGSRTTPEGPRGN